VTASPETTDATTLLLIVREAACKNGMFAVTPQAVDEVLLQSYAKGVLSAAPTGNDGSGYR
jgi:hypothetical protein